MPRGFNRVLREGAPKGLRRERKTPITTSRIFARQHFPKETADKIDQFVKRFGGHSFSIDSPKGRMFITFFSGNKQCDITIQGKNVVATFVDLPTPNVTRGVLVGSKHANAQLTREKQMRLMVEKMKRMQPTRRTEKKYPLKEGDLAKLRNSLSTAINESVDVLMDK